MAGVATTSSIYDYYAPQWERCRDTSNGTDAVKGKNAKYLPMLDSHKEKPEKYEEYKARALFYNATGRTVQGLSGGIFQKAPAVDAGAAEADIKDITLNGQPLDMFALTTTKEFLVSGRYGILVDLSDVESTTPRPYWVGYRAEDIINWKFENDHGNQKLSMVVLREYVDKPNPEDEFDIKKQAQYRVLRLNGGVYTQQIYTQKEGSDGTYGVGNKSEYVGGAITIPTRRGVALDFIPFALPWTIAQPPLLDLVDVNLSHYRGTADLKHGLHYTALPTPWVSGQSGQAAGTKPLQIGSGTAWVLESGGRAGMVEFTGSGLGAIRTDLQDMQKMMATLGARLLEEAPHYAETALSVSMRHSSDYATLRTIAQVVEQQLTYALQIHAWWATNDKDVLKIPVKVELNKVFFDIGVTADELRALLLSLQAGAISFKTFYQRLSDSGLAREGITEEEEKTDIAADGDKFKAQPKNAATGLPSETVAK